MKKSYYQLLFFFVFLFFTSKSFSQSKHDHINHDRKTDFAVAEKLSIVQLVFDADSVRGFNDSAAWQQARLSGAPIWEQQIFVAHLKRNYIDTKYHVYGAKIFGGGDNKVQAACTNVDFETGTTAGWTITEGLNTNSATQAGCCPTASTRVSVVTPGFDPIIPALATVPAGGGNYSLLLGDRATITGHAVKASQIFTVTAANSIFVYKYAIALEDAQHTCADQPYFNIAFTDCSNNPIPCADYNVVPSSASCTGGDPAFTTVTGTNGWSYFWKNWTTKSFDLSAYIGQCVKIEFIASDCVQTGHAGWAYVDCSCQPMTLNLNGINIPVGQTNNNLCQIGPNTLCAPPGFTSYSWSGPGVNGQTSQCVNPSSVGNYSVVLGQAGNACLSPTLTSSFSLVPAPITNFSFTAIPCQNTLSVPFTSSVNLNGGPPITFYNWDFTKDGVVDNNTANPTFTFPAYGTYTTQLQVSNGACVNTMTRTIVIQPTPTVTTGSVAPICPGACTPLSAQAYQYTTTTTNSSPSFNASPAAAISTVGTSTTTSTINVSGLSSATLTSVCLNISHTWSSDLDIYLVCPSGTTLELSTDNGGTSANTYTNTCFKVTSVTGITAATTPFNAAAGYVPEGGSLNGLAGCTMNGAWKLIVMDDAGGDGGTFNNWSLSFNNSSTVTNTITVNSFTWSPAVTSGGATLSPTVCPATTTVYTITGTGANGCTASNTVNVLVNNTTTITATNPTICVGASTPLSASGATSYTWAPATGLSSTTGATVTASPTITTNYTVTGTNGSCTNSFVTSVVVNPKPSATLSFTNPTCGSTNGIIAISNTSGAGQTVTSFTSNLGSVSGQTVTGLGASTPIITLTNNFGCTFTVSTTLTMTPGPTNFSLTAVNTTCGNSNGSLTFGTPTGGTPSYSYSINGGAFNAPSPTNSLSIGTYSVTIKDANGCVLTKTVTITNIPGPTALTGTTTPAGCGLSNGSFTVTGVTGGTPTYSFGVDGTAVTTSSVTSSLAAGTHTALVKDANGCIFSTTFNVGSLSGPSAATVMVTNGTCGLANGSATVTAVAGTTSTPFQYSFDGGAFSTTANVGSLALGTHTVNVKDANNCAITITYSVGNTGIPTASIAATNSVLCNGGATGSFTVNASGGLPGYGYTITPTGASNTTGLFSSLTAQTYTINLKDAAGCSFSLTNIITQPAALTLTLTPQAVSCNGGTNGTITATAANGTPTYQYAVDGGSFQASNIFTGLSAGTHSVTVKDNNNCTLTTTTTIIQPLPLAITFTANPTACVGATGTATIGVTGGTTAYTYSVDGTTSTNQPTALAFGTHTATVVDAKGCIITGTFNTTMVTGPTASTVMTTDATCGSANGSSTVSATTGGLAPYQYSFDGGAFSTTNNIGSLSAGTHTVIVKDANSCTLTANYVVNNSGSPTASVSAFANIACFGGTTGSITVSASGGSPGYNYTLTPGGTTNTTGVFTSLSAQAYNITVKDVLGCVTTTSITLTQPTALTLSLTPTTVSCNAGSNGTVLASGANGTGALQYSLNGGGFQSSSSFTALTAGNYTITVKDANNCTLSQITTITQPTAVTATVTAIPNSCNGTVGAATITANGGTPGYSYSVDAVSSTSQPSGLASGSHTATISDNNGCLITKTFSVGFVTGPSSATVNTTNSTCGNANGSATVTGVTGGLSSYQYSYDGAAFTTAGTVSGLSAGVHTLTVLDANSCTLTTTYNVLNTGSPTASLVGVTNPLCVGASNGSFSVTASGGNGAPFSYTLTSPSVVNATGVFGSLPAGSYLVNIKDAAGCLVSATATLTDPSPVTLSVSSSPALCFGTATGSISISGAGGTPTYSYNLNNGTYQTSPAFTAQFAGVYNMGIKDANGCTATQSVQINQPTALAINVSSQNANCTASNGIGTATVTGGTPIYTYTWTGGGGAGSTSNGLPTGSYTVTVTDANGCVISSPVTIGVTTGGTAIITGSSNITCFNANNGSLSAGMIGAATAPFTYAWSPGGQTLQTATNLAPGTYSCTITDFYGCVSTTSAMLTQPPVLNLGMSSFNAKCFGTATGTITASGSGGTMPYSYFWPALSTTLSSVSNVAAGTYSCVLTDGNGCSVTNSIVVTEPVAVSLTSTVVAANCNQANGSVTVTALGGTPAYSYTWSTGTTGATLVNTLAGTYTVNVQDANNCFTTLAATIPNLAGPTAVISTQSNVSCFGGNNGLATVSAGSGTPPYIYTWNDGQNTPTATNLVAGVKTVSVTDQAGCVASASLTITEPDQLTVSITASNPKCFGATNGYGIAAALGGTPSYTYAWTGGGGSSTTSNPLGAGNYGLSVTDANGCVVTSTMALINPPAMAASITSTDVSCFAACNGVAVATSTNNVGIVDYMWIGGASPIISQTITNVCAGTYTMIAMDQNSCTATSIVTINEPAALTSSISLTGSVTCNGGNDGLAAVSAGGGTPSYSYSWSGLAAPNGNSSSANNLPAGNYTVTVTDTKSCITTANVTIIEPTPLTATLTSSNPKCNGSCDGAANIAYSGGSGTTTFLWQPGLQTSGSVNSLCAGNHTVTITSNGSCVQTKTVTLIDPPALTAVVTPTNSNCGQNNGRVCAVVGGGTGTLSYQWSNGPTTLCNNNIVAGAYTFTVTDANLCSLSASGLVNDVAGPTVVITNSTAVKCFGGNDGSAITSITGGIGTYSISWSGTAPLVTTQNVTTLNAGIHNIVVIDAAGCIGTASVDITQPDGMVSAIGSSTNVSCFGYTNGGATVLVNGGAPAYSYSWTPSAQTSSVLTGVGVGTYSCLITDLNSCTTQTSVVITEPMQLTMTGVVTDVACNAGSNGQIAVTVQNGTPGYTYSWTPSQTNSNIVGSLVAGSYNLVVTDTKSCNINANFTINQPAPLVSSYSSLPATCNLSNGSATVSVMGGTQNYNLTWNTSTPQTGSVAVNMSPGSIWQCSIVDAHGCSLTQTVNIDAAPTPTITTKTVTQPLCFGQTNGSIKIDYISGTPNYVIAWSNPISQTVTTAALTSSVNGVGAGVYSFTVMDNYGCRASDFVNVVSPPILTLTTSTMQTICYGETSQIYASAGGGTGAYSYSWTPSTFSGAGPHTVSPTTTTFYTVAVSDVNGCSPSPKIITVAVTPSLSIAATSFTVCENSSVALTPTITSAGRGAPYDFIWSNGAASSNTTTSLINVVATLPNPNQYTVTIQDGCSIPGTAIFTVNVNPLPAISFSSNILQGCSPLQVILTGTSDNPNYDFSWTDFGLTDSQTAVTLADTGYHNVSLTVTNPTTQCTNTLVKREYIRVFPVPEASFYPIPGFEVSIIDPTFNFINTSTGAINYFWDFGTSATNGSGTSVLENPIYSYSVTGEFAVNLAATNQYGCRDVATITVEVKPEFLVYIPNSFTPDGNGLNDFFQPQGIGINEDNYSLDIFDRWGENIFSSNNFQKGWDGTVKGSSKTAPQGVYVYKIMVYDLDGKKHPFVGHVTLMRVSQ